MLAILDPAIRRASRGRAHAAMVIAGVAGLSLTIAAVSPARSSAAPGLASDAMALPDTMHPSASAEVISVAPTAPPAEAMASAELRAQRAEAPRVTAVAPAPSVAPRPLGGNDGDKLGRALGLAASSAAKEILAGLGLGVGMQQTAAADTGRIALLIKVLQTDSDAEVRRAAAWGLSEVETPAARAALAKALQSDADSEVREMSAWSLAEHEGGESAAALAAALLHDKSVKVRQTAAWGLGQAGRRADANALVSALSDGDPEVRETSIWALGQIDLDRVPATLLNALGDTSPRVREITAWTLGQIGDTTAVRPLVRAFESESDAKLKEMYLWSLSQIGTAPTDLIDSAMKSSDPELRRHAVALLTGRGGSWPMPMPRPMPRPFP